MSLLKSTSKIVRSDLDTPGGVTYYVIPPGEDTARAFCYRQLRKKGDERCAQPAGFKTWHVGTGACYLHGGASSEASPTFVNGRKSKLRIRLQERIDEYLDKDRESLLDLTNELAVSKSVFDELLEQLPDPTAEDYGIWFYRFNQALNMISNLVDKVAKIDNRNSLTAAQVMYLRATVADILMKYISDPDQRERAARELASRMGGDHEVTINKHEYSLPGEI
jgi:hypothetical protein